MTVSLVYSSVSPWMRRNRGIFPLYSCFRIVEYTSSPGHGGRGVGKGRQLLEVSPLGMGTDLITLPQTRAAVLPSNRTREFSSGLKGA